MNIILFHKKLTAFKTELLLFVQKSKMAATAILDLIFV